MGPAPLSCTPTAALNCHNTIARNEDDYAEIAIAFGLRPRALRRAKACVRKGKLDAPLFDTALWVRDQEVFVISMCVCVFYSVCVCVFVRVCEH
jgi:predicted O-linked N-acetylglucosamine transferase (SPINDLY family)